MTAVGAALTPPPTGAAPPRTRHRVAAALLVVVGAAGCECPGGETAGEPDGAAAARAHWAGALPPEVRELIERTFAAFPAPTADLPAGLQVPASLIRAEGRLFSRADGMELVYVGVRAVEAGASPGIDPGATYHLLMDRFEVTRRQWALRREMPPRTSHNDPVDTPPDSPVMGVNFFDAAGYAAAVGRSLPTFAEWEAAWRSDGRRFPWGEEDQLAGEPWQFLYYTFSSAVRPVGTWSADCSAEGCFDLGGGAREWTTTPDTGAPPWFVRGTALENAARRLVVGWHRLHAAYSRVPADLTTPGPGGVPETTRGRFTGFRLCVRIPAGVRAESGSGGGGGDQR